VTSAVEGQRNLLVVEDDPTVRRVVGMVLRGAGYGVDAADSGAAALHRLEEGGLDGVVLDLGLPDGRAGDVLAWLHAHEERPPWLVLSSMDRSDAARLDSSISPRFLSKPFDPKELLERVRSMTVLANRGGVR
jgi:DNA-binding response OmpR family regulator